MAHIDRLCRRLCFVAGKSVLKSNWYGESHSPKRAFGHCAGIDTCPDTLAERFVDKDSAWRLPEPREDKPGATANSRNDALKKC
jgi:hypothetical protein